MTTFWNHVSGLFSTPTTEGASRIETEYLAGTQEEWQHQCPNCGEFHVLRHTDMDCPEMEESRDKDGNKTYIIREVLWRCPDCGKEFTERQMKDTPQKYIVKNAIALENGIRSFFVNGFSSPWLTWTEIMKEWFVARGDPVREQNVPNSVRTSSIVTQGKTRKRPRQRKRRGAKCVIINLPICPNGRSRPSRR